MKRGHLAIRTCRSCGRKAPKQEMNRFVLEQERLVEDDQGKGYGLYCCPDTVCRTKMDKKLKKKVRADKERGRE